MSDFNKRLELETKQEKQMLKLAKSVLKGLPSNVTLECWTIGLVVVKIDNFSTLRLLIDWTIGKEPKLRIEKDVQCLSRKGEQLRKILTKQRKLYASTIIPEYLRMYEERNSL